MDVQAFFWDCGGHLSFSQQWSLLTSPFGKWFGTLTILSLSKEGGGEGFPF
jgi:hypothetical protein